jgi:hypothetical protein
MLEANPQHEDAWLWMSAVVDTDEQRIDCLTRVLAINPDNAPARKGLAHLQKATVAPPATDDTAASETWIRCPACGSDNSPLSTVCSLCGRPLATEAVPDLSREPVPEEAPPDLAPALEEAPPQGRPSLARIALTSILLLMVCGVCLAGSILYSRLGMPVSELFSTGNGDVGIVPLDFGVIDAEYSPALDRIVMISDEPAQLHLYDPSTGTDTTIDLSRSPTSVSVGPDGRFAAIGHDAQISYVDLERAQVIKTLDVATDVCDVVLAGNGWIYASPSSGESDTLRGVDVETGNEVESTGLPVLTGTVYRLHPDGQSLYGVQRGAIPSDLIRIDISQGVPTCASEGPYQPDYDTCADLWLSEDGRRIFTACGNIFRTSSDSAQDMTYAGALANLGGIADLAHSSSAGIVLAASGVPLYHEDPTIVENRLVFLDDQNLGQVHTIDLPDLEVDGISHAVEGRFVFINADGTRYYVIVEAARETAMAGHFGLFTADLALEELAVESTASVPPEQQGTETLPAAGGVVPLTFRVTDAAYSSALDKIVMVSDDPPQLHIYDPGMNTDTAVELSASPRLVSVGPDGKFAAVGHERSLSYVNLETAQVVNYMDMEGTVTEVVLDGDGWAYVLVLRDEVRAFEGISMGTGERVPGPSGELGRGTVYRLHPDGNSLYGTTTRSSGDIEKIIISDGVPSEYYSSDSSTCGDLWLSEDGQRIFTACGDVFRASLDRENDMVKSGSLTGLNLINHLVHSTSAGVILAVGVTGWDEQDMTPMENQVLFFEHESMTLQRKVTLPGFVVSGLAYFANGRFVFVNAAGTQYYVIVQADPDSALLDDFGVVTGELSLEAAVPAVAATVLPDEPVEEPPTAAEGPIVPLDFLVIDAEYSLALDKIVMVSDDPARLHLYDPATQTDSSVDLSRSPTSVSVGPDGTFAAVGHDAQVSYVDLAAGQVVKTLGVSMNLCDVVLAGNGWVYVSSGDRGEMAPLRGVNIETGEVVQCTRLNNLRDGTLYKLHPDGQALYGATTRGSPGNIERIDISAGAPVYAYQSRYWGEYPMGGNIWLSEDGELIFSDGGLVFRASADREKDITYAGSLPGLDFIHHLVHSASAGLILAIADRESWIEDEGPVENQIAIFDAENLTSERVVDLPDFVVNEQPFAANGRFVFVNAAGTQYSAIVQSDSDAGGADRYGVVTGDPWAESLPAASATPVPTGREVTWLSPPEGEVLPLAFPVVDAEYSLALDRIVMVSRNPAQLHVYDPATGTDTAVDLSRPPTSVSVGPDGQHAVVGHDARISYVDILNPQVVRTLDVPSDTCDVVLAGNGWAYASSPLDDFSPLRGVNIDTNELIETTDLSMHPGTMYKLHPDGLSLYAATATSSSNLEKIDISEGGLVWIGQAPSVADDHSACRDLWLSEDGQRIFTACGHVFRASPNRELDMAYAATLANLARVQHLVHSSSAARVLAVRARGWLDEDSEPVENQVLIYGYDDLSFERVVTLPDFALSGEQHTTHGRFVFVNAAGTQYYVIAQAAEDSDLLGQFAVFTGGM